jgi:hypothetical protein
VQTNPTSNKRKILMHFQVAVNRISFSLPTMDVSGFDY